MAVVTLTTNGITFTFNASDVVKVEETGATKPDNVEIATVGPMGTLNYDYEGVSKIIVVEGVLTEASTSRTSTGTVTTIIAQKQWLESLGNGSQETILFTSTYGTQSVLQKSGAVSPYQAQFASTEVMLGAFKFTEMTGKPTQLQFSLTFVVGDT